MVSTKAECIYANVKNYIYYLEKYNSYLLFNPYIHQWLSLNRIGSEIVSALEKHKTIDGAVEELRERYKLSDEQINEDIIPYIELLKKKHFLVGEGEHMAGDWTKVTVDKFLADSYYFTDMYISLSDSCNLKCCYCFNSNSRKERDEGSLSRSEMEKLIKEYSEIGGRGVVFTGGEPTLYKDLIPLAKYASECNIEVKMITNGTLLSSLELDKLMKYMSGINISLDSVDTDVLTKLWNVEGEPALNRITEGLKRIDDICKTLDKKPLITISPIVTALNKDSLDRVYKFCCKTLRNCSLRWNLTPYEPVGCAETDNMLSVSRGEYIDAYCNAFESAPDSKERIKREALSENGKRFAHNVPALLCCAPSFLVTASGNVYPCQKLERDEYLLGNIKERSIKEMAESELFRKVKFSLGIDTNNKCAGCEFKYLCTFKGGLCKKDVYPKEANCREYNIEMLYLQTIYKR